MKTIKGDLLYISQGLIAHQVNAKGVMGAGLALQIRQKYPDIYNQYLLAIQQKQLKLGDVQIIQVNDRIWVANVVGQENYGRAKGVCYTNYDSLEVGLARLRLWQDCTNQDVYLPYGMGAGLAGGDWQIIEMLISKKLPRAILVSK